MKLSDATLADLPVVQLAIAAPGDPAERKDRR